jgi:hypothetical protein
MKCPLCESDLLQPVRKLNTEPSEESSAGQTIERLAYTCGSTVLFHEKIYPEGKIELECLDFS